MDDLEKFIFEKEIPLFIIIEYIKIRIEKSIKLKEQRYEIAARFRDDERQLINKYPLLETFNQIIKNIDTETLKQQIRNLKIYILLNE